jgi:hypothetical protein
MDHYNLLTLIARLSPRLIIIDSEFCISPDPVIRLIRERTDNDHNAVPHLAGQVRVPVGIPSQKALRWMADSLGYGVEWSDWETLKPGERLGLEGYFQVPPAWKRRNTCALRPLPTT